MVLCFGSKPTEPVDEYDPIPFSLSWRMRWSKRETDPHTNHSIMRLSSTRLLQWHCDPTEYQALKVVGKHTSVPIYKVITVYNRPEGKLVEYEARKGRPLDHVWPTMTEPQRAKTVRELSRAVEQLRQINPPKHCVVGDTTLGGISDHRFGEKKVGPFYTIHSFQEFQRRGHSTAEFSEKEIKTTHERTYELKYTHGHLVPRNILVDDMGRICIINWKSSGWRPEYWEYTQMCLETPKTMGDWLEAMKETLPRYDQELACEEALKARYSPSVYEHERSVRAPSPAPSELHREQTQIDDLNTENTSG